MSLVGNNDLIFILRVLTSMELFLNANYYCEHPILANAVEKKKLLPVYQMLYVFLCHLLQLTLVW